MLNTIVNLNNINTQRHNEDVYKTTIVGTSDCNDYMPIFALGAHKVLKIMPEDVTIVEYCMPLTDASTLFNSFRTYTDLLYYLKEHSSTNRPAKYRFTIGGEMKYININRGIIFDDDGVILMCMAIKTRYILSTPKEAIIAGTNADKYVLFITKEFNDPIYKNIRKKLETTYISVASEAGVDIIISNRINNWIFNNNLEKKKFKNVIEMKKHLREEVPQMILEL